MHDTWYPTLRSLSRSEELGDYGPAYRSNEKREPDSWRCAAEALRAVTLAKL